MSEEKWLSEISAKRKLIDLNFREIWRYRDLLMLFVKRDIAVVYKQTILGPLWFFIQPLFTSVIFTLIFNNMGGIQTGGVPSFLFNLTGITAWNYFRSCLASTSNTFVKNQAIFGKVYFPRVIMPMSVTISNLVKFGIQLLILFGFFFYYQTKPEYEYGVNSYIFLFPVYVLIMALMGLGLGMIISSATTKYRDLTVMVGFGVQLLMYMSAVPYPISEANSKFPAWAASFVEFNPLSQIIEGFRFMLLDFGSFDWMKLGYTFGIAVIVFLIGLIIFNKTEKSFIDTV